MSRSGREARSEAREERGGGGRDRMRLKRGLQVAGRLQSQVGRWAEEEKGRDWRRFVHLHLAPRVVPAAQRQPRHPDTQQPITHHPSPIHHRPVAHQPSPMVAADALPRPIPAPLVPRYPSSPAAQRQWQRAKGGGAHFSRHGMEICEWTSTGMLWTRVAWDIDWASSSSSHPAPLPHQLGTQRSERSPSKARPVHRAVPSGSAVAARGRPVFDALLCSVVCASSLYTAVHYHQHNHELQDSGAVC